MDVEAELQQIRERVERNNVETQLQLAALRGEMKADVSDLREEFTRTLDRFALKMDARLEGLSATLEHAASSWNQELTTVAQVLVSHMNRTDATLEEHRQGLDELRTRVSRLETNPPPG